MKAHKVVSLLLLGITAVFAMALVLGRGHWAIISPAGQVAAKERNLIIFALLLSLIVVVPVFVMLFAFAWRYREGNTKAKYTPDADRNKYIETVWWGVPLTLIFILSVVTWNSSHALDPYRPLSSSNPPLTIQVVALQWRWLFIYPKQHIATMNYFRIPVNTPVSFEITADAPMNSFWIPRLGSQVYAMPGMSTALHLEASSAGWYTGSSANISGDGFAGMHFVAQASSQTDFDEWVRYTQAAGSPLTAESYAKLAQPSHDTGMPYFGLQKDNLYDTIVNKYMTGRSQ